MDTVAHSVAEKSPKQMSHASAASETCVTPQAEDKADDRALKQYELSYATYRYCMDLYVRATSFFFLMTLAPLGFILQGKFSAANTRLLSLCMCVIMAVWYIGNFFSLRYERQAREEHSSVATKLGFHTSPVISRYTVAGHAMAMLGTAPILFVFIYLVACPKSVGVQ